MAELQGLERELQREMPPGHRLAALAPRAVARRDDCDDVLFSIPGGHVAVVHLSWRRETDPDYPQTSVHASMQAWLEAERSERASD